MTAGRVRAWSLRGSLEQGACPAPSHLHGRTLDSEDPGAVQMSLEEPGQEMLATHLRSAFLDGD